MNHKEKSHRASVLFLCNANSASLMLGEALLRHLAGDRFEAFATEPDHPHEFTLAALRKQGISCEGLASQSLDDFADEHFDAVIVLCDKAQRRPAAIGRSAEERLYWDIRDPRLIGKTDAYEQALQEIRRRLQLELLARR
ncbi:arsenate reductase ArsC [Billgrantia gudaonensis]|uniref:Arsenate reductase ArsC n=1 Tax=Billgrantia gudaonensis TaxID=376427 RepID=A0A3S0NX42_9GAMM|nr:arsenate reductase ArsC [Halomonas gudaonensis]